MSVTVIDSLAVCGTCLAELLRPIVAQEHMRQKDHRLNHNQWSEKKHGAAGFADVLAAEAGMSPRRLYGILRCEFATVGLTQADNLCCALDRPDLVHVLEVYPRKRGRRMGVGAGMHIYACPKSVAACRLAPLEPASPARTARGCGDASSTTTDREADAPTAERRAA